MSKSSRQPEVDLLNGDDERQDEEEGEDLVESASSSLLTLISVTIVS